jgi:hypothetical protein
MIPANSRYVFSYIPGSFKTAYIHALMFFIGSSKPVIWTLHSHTTLPSTVQPVYYLPLFPVHASAVHGHHQVWLFAKTVSLRNMRNFTFNKNNATNRQGGAESTVTPALHNWELRIHNTHAAAKRIQTQR